MMFRVDTNSIARRGGFNISPAAVMRAARSNSGRRALIALRGLGSLGEACTPGDVSGQLTEFDLSWSNNVSWELEQANAGTPDQYLSDLTSSIESYCNGTSWGCSGNRCTVPYDQIQAMAAAYAANYNSTLANLKARIAAGDICGTPGFLAQNPDVVLSQRAMVGCGYGATPPSGGGGSTAYTVPVTAAAPVSTSSAAPTGGGSSTIVGATPVQATLVNLSRPNQPLQPGDAWSLTINGAPNSAVSIAGSQNGVSKGNTPFGTTDANGNKVISGTMTPNEIGSWNETVSVGAGTPAVISFSVVAPPAAPGPTGGGGSTDTGNTSAPGGATTGGTTAGTTPTPAPPPPSGIDTSSVLMYAAIAAGLFLVFGGRR
jgi:hypothetical protein